MFESIKEKLTVRNVVCGVAVVAAVAGVAYYFLKDGKEVDLSDKGVQDILDAAGVVASDAVQTASDVVADTAKAA